MTNVIVFLVLALKKFIFPPYNPRKDIIMYLKYVMGVGLVLIFVAWLNYELRKASRQNDSGSAKFWARESEALLTPRKSIDDVKFIVIPKEIIPKKIKPLPVTPPESPSDQESASESPSAVPADPRDSLTAVPAYEDDPDDDDEDEEDTSDSYETHVERINTLSAELKVLSKKQIADLSEYTNTDLRIKYGSPNFNQLFEADNNFTRLVQIMPILINSLIKIGKVEEAAGLLDFCDENAIVTGELKKLRSEFRQ